MRDLIKTNLRFTTFNKFTVIIAVLLFYQAIIRIRPGDNDSWLLIDYKYALVVICAAVLVKSERDKHSGFYRDMIASGYLRRQVLAAHLISCALYGGMLFLCVAIPMSAAMPTPVGFVTHAMIFMFCSMIVGCVSMLINNFYCVLLVILTIGLVYVSVDSLILDPLYRSKYNYDYVEEPSDTSVEKSHYIPKENRLYVGGLQRTFYKALAYMNPVSQMNSSVLAAGRLEGFDYDPINFSKNENPMIYELTFPLVTLGMMTALTLGGCVFFRKKDLF